MTRVPAQSWIALSIVLILAAGFTAVYSATASGIGVSPDSVQYIAAALRLLEGHGLQGLSPGGEWTPLTRFPPLYPLILACAAWLAGGDPLAAARGLHALLLPVNILLLWRLAQRLIPNARGLPVLAAAGFALAPVVVRIHSEALSEPLFITVLLIALIQLLRYTTTPQPAAFWMLCAGCALSVLTRYAGAALVIACACVLLTAGNPIRSPSRRLQDAGILAAVSCLPLACWVLRNRLAAGTLVDRSLHVSLPDRRDAQLAIATVWEWVFPWPLSAAVLNALAANFHLILALVVCSVVWWGVRRSCRLDAGAILRPGCLASVTFGILYIVFLLASRILLGMTPAFHDRLLLPLFVVGITPLLRILGVRRTDPIQCRRWAIFVICLWIVSSAMHSAGWVLSTASTGHAFSSHAWRTSPLIACIRGLPEDLRLVSNAPDAVYLWTGRTAALLPAHHEPISGRPNTRFAEELARLQDDLRSGRCLVAFFDRVEWRWYLPTRSELLNAVAPTDSQVRSFDDGLLIGPRPSVPAPAGPHP